MITMRVRGVSKRYRVRKGAIDVLSFMPHRIAERRARRKKLPPPKEIWALRDVNFKTDDGTILGVIGPNGAGKSTLLKVLGRISPPTTGRIEVLGRLVPMLEVGAAFQPDATGRENIYLNAALYGIPRAVVNQKLDGIVEFAGVERFLDTQVKRYSSGMYLRLAFSIAVNMEPDILLADEVLAVGDLAFQEQCLRRVEEAGHEGMTVVFVSHDMAAVRRLCNRVIWINEGRIVEDGATEDVVAAYEQANWKLLAGSGDDRSANEYGEIIHTRLFSTDGRELSSAAVGDELLLRVTLRVDRPGVGFRCVLAFGADGVDAFRSVQPAVVEATEPGIYETTVRIPPHLLSDIVYTVKTEVRFSVNGRERPDATIARDHSLTFRVYDVQDPDSARGTYSGPLKGLLRPRLVWQATEAPRPLTGRALAALDQGSKHEPNGRSGSLVLPGRTNGEARRSTPGVSAAVYSVTGSRVDVLATDEEAMVEIALDVVNAPARLRCQLDLESSGVQVQCTPTVEVRVDEPGRRYVSTRIPPGALPTGVLRGCVTVTAAGEGEGRVLTQDESAFTLTVLAPREHAVAAVHGSGDPPHRELSSAWVVSDG